jgi:hypothetical protein
MVLARAGCRSNRKLRYFHTNRRPQGDTLPSPRGFLVIGAGTVINPIIKIVTTVAVLAAAYFFIIRPVLDTTEKVVDDASKSFQDFNTGGGGSGSGNTDFEYNSALSLAESRVSSLQGPWPEAARHIEKCIKAAELNANRMQRCADKGEALVFDAQSDRNFAMSYATSIEAQGNSSGADKVRDCVKKAEFNATKVAKCRALADRLLFG